MTAAYAEPWVRFSLMMRPALAHGTTPGTVALLLPASGARMRSVSEVTRTVTLPSPDSGWRTK